MEDLDFADDLALLSHNHKQMQEKTEQLNTVSIQLGLNIKRSKTKNNNPITLNGEPLEETVSFTYMGSKINKTGRHRRRRQTKNTESKSGIHHVEKIFGEQNTSKLTPN